MTKHKRIKDLPLSARPREKLLEKGPANVSDEELIALLLGSGTRKKNALLLAKSILAKTPLPLLADSQQSAFTAISGVGKTKVSRLLAAIELGRRLFSPPAIAKRRILTSGDALEQLRDIADKRQEHIVTLYLNARHELIERKTVSVGNLNTTYAEPRVILAPALMLPCASIVLAHNHPSDDPTPSSGDILFTKRIREAALILGIELVDHLIVSRSGYFSFLENGLMEK